MSWGRFSYICRKVSAECNDNESVSSCVARVESEEGCKLYGEEPKPGSLARQLLEAVHQLDDRAKALSVLNCYGEVDLGRSLRPPATYKRSAAYLAYLILLLHVLVGVYQIKVLPLFIDSFAQFDVPLPKSLLLFVDYHELLFSVSSLFLMGVFFVGWKLKGLFNFELGQEKSLWFRFFLSSGVRQSYCRLCETIFYPLRQSFFKGDPTSDSVSFHLDSLRGSSLDLPREMQELIDIEMKNLMEACEKQMKGLYFLVASVVVAAIFLFVASVYSPIFMIGETI